MHIFICNTIQNTPNGINRHTIFLYYLNSHHCTENVPITKKEKHCENLQFFSPFIVYIIPSTVRKCGLFEIYLHILGIYLFHIFNTILFYLFIVCNMLDPVFMSGNKISIKVVLL